MVHAWKLRNGLTWEVCNTTEKMQFRLDIGLQNGTCDVHKKLYKHSWWYVKSIVYLSLEESEDLLAEMQAKTLLVIGVLVGLFVSVELERPKFKPRFISVSLIKH